MSRKIFWLVFLFLTIQVYSQNKPLTLQDCIDMALKESPDYKLANIQMKSSKAGISASYSGILPRLSSSLGARSSTQGPSEYVFNNITFRRGDTTTYYYNFGLNLYQNIYDGGKWWNNIKLAKLLFSNSRLYMEQVRQYIIMNVTQKFYELLKAQQMLKVYQSALESSEEQLKKTEELFRVGKVAERDVFKARVNVGNNKLSLLQQKTAVENAQMELNFAIGRAPDVPIVVVEEEYKRPIKISKEEAVNAALSNNLELTMMEMEKETAFINYKINKADLYPSIYSSFSYSRGGAEFSKVYTPLDKWWNTSIGITLSWSIFDGFSRKSRIIQSWLDYKSYDEKIDKKKKEVLKQVDALLNMLNTYIEMLEISEVNIRSAEEDLRLAREMYKLNSATLLEVLDAEVKLTRAKAVMISTMYDAKIAEAQLLYLMGEL